MCGRYALHANPEVVALQFALDNAAEFKASYNVCPGREILVVRLDREKKRVARQYPWGLGNKIANARGEPLAQRPAFPDAFPPRPSPPPAPPLPELPTVSGPTHPPS